MTVNLSTPYIYRFDVCCGTN